MENRLEHFIYQRVKSPDKSEVHNILSIFQERWCGKGDLFKERDTQIKELGFILKGSARSYVVNKKGHEITGNITQENNFISDLISIRKNEKTPIIIEFLEKSEVVAAPIVEVKNLLEKNLTFNILIREYMADRTVELVRRQILFMNGTAKERYQQIIEANPSLLRKFPLRFIASMIGITPTQLSRIRNEKSI